MTNNWTEQFSYGVNNWLNAFKNSPITVDGTILRGTSDFCIYQRFKYNNYTKTWYGKILTLSILYDDGTVEYGSKYMNTDHFNPSQAVTDIFISISDNMLYTKYAQLENYTDRVHVVVTARANSAIKAVKLEVGSVSTLAMDTAPNYTLELAKCNASDGDNEFYYMNQGNIYMTSPRKLSSSDDLNSILETSLYYAVSSGRPLNIPQFTHSDLLFSNDFTLEVIKNSNNLTIMQRYNLYQNGIWTCIRRSADGGVTWSKWVPYNFNLYYDINYKTVGEVTIPANGTYEFTLPFYTINHTKYMIQVSYIHDFVPIILIDTYKNASDNSIKLRLRNLSSNDYVFNETSNHNISIRISGNVWDTAQET